MDNPNTCNIAGIAGSLIDYYIGLKGVQSLIQHKILGKVLLSTNQLEVAEKWFIKYGSLMVFISRIIPGFRTTFSFPAGAAKMKLIKVYRFHDCRLFIMECNFDLLGLVSWAKTGRKLLASPIT